MSYKDYGKQDWLKVLGITEEKVPELLVIEGSILMQRRLAERQKLLTNLTTIRFPNIIAGEANGKRVAYACAYGAPFAAELVHVLCASGTRLEVYAINAWMPQGAMPSINHSIPPMDKAY